MEQLKAAQASVDIAKADYVYSLSEYDRQKKMYKQNATSLNNVEKWQAKIAESAAEVKKQEANEQLAAITYGYTHVTAPFDGRIGRHLVSVGNLVGNGVATNLATIEQINPLYVYFNLNEIDLIKLREAARAAGFKPQDINTVPVDIALQNNNAFIYHATLDFVNTGLNASTGTMELRAILNNNDAIFVPGLFVNVRVAITKPKPELTVPDTSVLYDQIGPYLLTVDKKNKVVLKRVVLGPKSPGQQGILQGINKDDRIVTEGIQNAIPGNAVQLINATEVHNK
jgi:RND family efflux transporter MFP subunit